MTKSNLGAILDEIAAERGIDRQVLINAIETGISIAAQKRTRLDNLRPVFDPESGSITLLQTKAVKENVENHDYDITPEQAAAYSTNPAPGTVVDIPYNMPELGRFAAMATRKMMKKTVAEIEADNLCGKMMKGQWKMVTAIVRGINEDKDVLCEVAETPAELLRGEQAFREEFKDGELIKVLVTAVANRGGLDNVYIVSRTHPLLLRFLMEMEVPEIKERLVDLKFIARDTSGRSKVAVYAENPAIDAVGACIGPQGARIQRIKKELKGENIDVILWSEDPAKFIAASLIPAKVKSVKCNPEIHEAYVVLEPDQQSIAVGKGGLNIRLASRLTGWSIKVM